MRVARCSLITNFTWHRHRHSLLDQAQYRISLMLTTPIPVEFLDASSTS
jgi:hypothetical protein